MNVYIVEIAVEIRLVSSMGEKRIEMQGMTEQNGYSQLCFYPL